MNFMHRVMSCLVLLLAIPLAPALHAIAPTPPAAPAPTLEQRMAALEAYMDNRDPKAQAVTAAVAPVGPGHNAWMMLSAALVFFMTLPGLAMFYGGLIRAKNVLSIMAWCLGITSVIALLWWAFGYSLVFGRSFHSSLLGGTEFFFLRGVGEAPNPDYSFWVSHEVFAMYQLMFAIITPAVIVGAVVERARFPAVLLFSTLWFLVVYCPLAHMLWGATGLMNGLANPSAAVKAIDFAGGMVVEMASGWSALVLCLFVGVRRGFGRAPMPPHSMVLCMVGTGLLWFGWYGFNAGSALAADGIAGHAFTTTTMAAATAAGVWGLIEYLRRSQASVLGFCSGAVAGLVAITPACGYIDTGVAIGLGAAAGALSFFACSTIKSRFGYDDSLDVFGVHGVAGTLGTLVTGVFATTSVNRNLSVNLGGVVGHTLWRSQLAAMGITLLLATGGTALVAVVVRATVGLRIAAEKEHEGLDQSEHGEHGYIFDSAAS